MGDLQKMVVLKKTLSDVHKQIVMANLVKNWSLVVSLEEKQKALETELAYHYKDFPSYSTSTSETK